MLSTVEKHTKSTSSLCIILLAFITSYHNTQQSVMDSQDYYTATQEQLLQELVYSGTNISTIPITILYTSKKLFF